MTLSLDRFPSPAALYTRAAASAVRRPGRITTLPPLALRMERVQVEPRRLAAYRSVCGLPASETLPITYPQVLLMPLHMALMTQPKFPLPLLGLVHVANRIEQRRALSPDEVWAAEVRIGEARNVKAGLEFDLLTEVSVEGEAVWQAVTTIIHRQGKPQGGRSAPPAEAPALAQYAELRAPADTGRRYAAVSGDYNPIHLYAATARLFGFPRAIAHGMWSLARCLALLQPVLGREPARLEVGFKQPLLLPAKATLKWVETPEGPDFQLLAASGGKVHLKGTLR